LVPSEFDSISVGALSLPLISTLILVPSSALISGMNLSLIGAQVYARPPLKRSRPAAKPFSRKAGRLKS
jgi:hypothetical protein